MHNSWQRVSSEGLLPEDERLLDNPNWSVAIVDQKL